MGSRHHIEIIPDRCIGSGNCVDTTDIYFDQRDDDGTVILLEDRVQPQHEPEVEAAVNYCPVSALRMFADTEA